MKGFVNIDHLEIQFKLVEPIVIAHIDKFIKVIC